MATALNPSSRAVDLNDIARCPVVRNNSSQGLAARSAFIAANERLGGRLTVILTPPIDSSIVHTLSLIF